MYSMTQGKLGEQGGLKKHSAVRIDRSIPAVSKRLNNSTESSPPLNLSDVMVNAAEELTFDWPDPLPIERIKAGLIELALAFALFAGLVTLCWLRLFSIPQR
jgi:hypothetical protein